MEYGPVDRHDQIKSDSNLHILQDRNRIPSEDVQLKYKRRDSTEVSNGISYTETSYKDIKVCQFWIKEDLLKSEKKNEIEKKTEQSAPTRTSLDNSLMRGRRNNRLLRMKNIESWHLQRRINNRLIYQCPYCEVHSSQLGNLRFHMRIKHVAEMPLACSECNFTTDRQRSLIRHVSHWHSNMQDKPWTRRRPLTFWEAPSPRSTPQAQRSTSGFRSMSGEDPLQLGTGSKVPTLQDRPFRAAEHLQYQPSTTSAPLYVWIS